MSALPEVVTYGWLKRPVTFCQQQVTGLTGWGCQLSTLPFDNMVQSKNFSSMCTRGVGCSSCGRERGGFSAGAKGCIWHEACFISRLEFTSLSLNCKTLNFPFPNPLLLPTDEGLWHILGISVAAPIGIVIDGLAVVKYHGTKCRTRKQDSF